MTAWTRGAAAMLGTVMLWATATHAQTGEAPARSLSAVVQELQSHQERRGPEWTIELDRTVREATAAELEAQVPALVGLTESPVAAVRADGLLVLYAIATRTGAGGAGSQREPDAAAPRLLVPYLPRLTPRLTDPETGVRAGTLMLFQIMAGLRPTPPALLRAALDVLQGPGSTQMLHDTRSPVATTMAPSVGAQMLYVLLVADAVYFKDPGTGITEGQDSPEVQAAILTFLRRPDQTAESLTEAVRALAVAQVQNPAVNDRAAELLLESGDPAVVRALLRHVDSLTLTPDGYLAARASVTTIAGAHDAPAETRTLAASLLRCWTNDRHHDRCSSPATR